MNIKLFTALSLSLLTVACASSTQRALVDNCVTTTPPINCAANKPKDKINLIVSGPNLKVAPPNVCSDPNATIEVSVVQGANAVTVVAVPKDAKNGWILATNVLDPTKMTINVPGTTKDGNYDYLFITSDGRCYDPRIRIGPE